MPPIHPLIVRSLFSTRSLRGRLTLVVMLATAIALLTMTVALLHRDLTNYWDSLATDLRTEAAILSLSTAPAIAFDDRRAAVRNLSALSAKAAVQTAALYAADGSLYAVYVRPGAAAAPARLPQGTDGIARLNGGRMEVARVIVQDGERLGTLHLTATYDIWTHVRSYVGLLILIMLVSMLMALALSGGLRRSITEPVETLARVAREIIERRDPTLRAPDTPLAEFSQVVTAFNSVLDESEERTRELRRTNEALKQQVTERIATESALALANARLESTMAAAEIGSWMWNLETQEVTVDRNLVALHGRDAVAPVHGDASLLHRHIHPDDLQRVLDAERAALVSGRLESTEYRILREDGSTRWVVSRGTLLTDLSRRPVMLLGLLIDITAQRVAERALRQSEKLYRAIGESIDYGVWVTDSNGRNVYASESFLRLMGMSQAQCSNLGWTDLLHPDDVAGTVEAWQECVRSGGTWYREHRFRGADGAWHPILAQGVPIHDEDGERAGWAGINLDISRMKRNEEALREADRRKDEFLATLAHELRNPLAPIRHAARLLGLKDLGESQSQSARDIIARQVARMALLLDDLLEVSRITRQRLELRLEPTSAASLVRAAIETTRPLIEAKRHTMEVHPPADDFDLVVDPLRMSQALSNLLTNAAKYTDPGGRITLHLDRHAREVVFSVGDSGIGLPAQVLPNIFEMFSQVDSAIDRSEGGLGIGLALVKGLVELHGGRVEAASAGLGLGSTFRICLPASTVRERTKAEQPVPQPRVARVGRGPRGRVLVVDDNRDAADSLAMVLSNAGHETFTAYTGEQALLLCEKERPQAVVLDIGMPDMTGYEAAQRIRRNEWGTDLLLLAITGWGQKEDVERATRAGFDFHLTKPADPERVEKLLSDYLERLQEKA